MGNDLESLLFRPTPTMQLQDWLKNNTDSLRMIPERDIILQARLALGSQLAGMDNGDIAWEIHKWAQKNSFLPVDLPSIPGSPVQANPGATPVRGGDPQILDSLKGLLKTLQSIPTEIKWVGNDGSAGISVSGATVVSGKGSNKATFTAGWDRTLELKTDISGMTFSAKIDPVNQNWNMTFTIGRQAPNLSDVANVFQQGDAAIQGVLANAGKVDLKNPTNTLNAFKPYVDPIKNAVDAAGKIAAQRPGDISFGVSLKGGFPGAPSTAGGFTATAVFTVVF